MSLGSWLFAPISHPRSGRMAVVSLQLVILLYELPDNQSAIQPMHLLTDPRSALPCRYFIMTISDDFRLTLIDQTDNTIMLLLLKKNTDC